MSFSNNVLLLAALIIPRFQGSVPTSAEQLTIIVIVALCSLKKSLTLTMQPYAFQAIWR